MQQRDAGDRRGRSSSAPTPTGPPSLWAVSVSASTPLAAKSTGSGADGLHGVGVHRDAVLVGDRGELGDRLDGADLVVGPHHADQRDVVRVALERRAHASGVDPADGVDRRAR